MTGMQKKYWDMFWDFKIAEYYYQFYAIRSSRQKGALSIFCAVGSATFVISWYQSGVAPLLWASLILAAQIISVAQPYLPFDKRLIAANYIHSDVSWMVLDIENTWNTFDAETPDEVFSEKISAFRAEYQRIEDRFAEANTVPQNLRLHRKAQSFTEVYFRRFY